jgi:hypothetical protein
MLSLRLAPFTAVPSAAERVVAPARAAAHAAPAAERAEVVRTGVAGVVAGVSTVAISGAGTLESIPAALGRMRDIAVVTSSGILTDVDRAKLRTEYGKLSQQVSDLIGTDPMTTRQELSVRA